MPTLSNVAITDTFDTWRVRTNQIIVKGNEDETISVAAYNKANSANVLAYNTGIGANAFTSATIAGANTAVGAGANSFTSATITGANTISIAAFNTANAAVTTTRNVSTSGIATGGGSLAADRTITVTKATGAQVTTGTDDTVAVTPKALRDAGVSSSDIRALAMMVSELKGDRINMPNGIVDPLTDTSDIGTNTNGTATTGKIVPSSAVTAVAQATGTAIGNMTNGGGNAAAFDGTTNQSGSAGALISSGTRTNGLVGKDWGSGNTKTVTGIVATASNDFGFNQTGGGTITITLWGSNAGFNTSGVSLGSDTIANANGAVFTKLTGFTTSTAYRYHWIDITSSSGTTSTDNKYCAELVLYEGSGVNNLTLISNAFTAASTPTLARLSVQAKAIDAFTINTDLIGYVSRDNGTTFTAATLVAETVLADDTTIYVHDGLVISAQPSGTSMKWKITTHNNKNLEVNGVGLQWL